MIKTIPHGQICQQFDTKMHLQNSVLEYHNTTQNATPSCIAPAYVYIEGTHGKKFLCDYHYHYEVYMTHIGYVKVGENIQEFIIDERERVKETFAKNVTSIETFDKKCSLLNSFNLGFGCIGDAFVKVVPTAIVPKRINFTVIKDKNNISQDIFYCNFHFRREYFRYLSNGIVYEDFHKVVDERYRMTSTIAEEALKLKYV